MFEEAKAALEDLLSIEINTIKKAGMSARRPPPFPWQLREIIDAYTDYLEGLEVCTDLVKTPDDKLAFMDGKSLKKEPHSLEDIIDVPTYLKNQADHDPALNDDMVTNGWHTFDKLRILAKYAYNGKIPGVIISNEEQRIMLVRIRRSCDLIKAILKDLELSNNSLTSVINKTENDLINNLQILSGQLNFKNVPLSYITSVRKIWEIGTESVLIQTVIQAEGDVITRITPNLVDQQNLADIREALFTVHRNSMDIGLTHWKNLIDIVLKLVSHLVTGK